MLLTFVTTIWIWIKVACRYSLILWWGIADHLGIIGTCAEYLLNYWIRALKYFLLVFVMRVPQLVFFLAAAHVFLVAWEGLDYCARKVFIIILPLSALLKQLLVFALTSQNDSILSRNIKLINCSIYVNLFCRKFGTRLLRCHLTREVHLIWSDWGLLLLIEIIASSRELLLQEGLVSMQLLQIHYLCRIELNLVFNFS